MSTAADRSVRVPSGLMNSVQLLSPSFLLESQFPHVSYASWQFSHVFFPLFVIAACVWHCTGCSLLYCRASSSSVSERRTQRWRGERAFKEISVALKNKMTVSFKALKERGCQICHVEIFCQSWLSNPIERLTNRAAPCTD